MHIPSGLQTIRENGLETNKTHILSKKIDPKHLRIDKTIINKKHSRKKEDLWLQLKKTR